MNMQILGCGTFHAGFDFKDSRLFHHNHSDLTIDIEQLLQSPNVTIQSPVIDFNTGFGERNDLHYETACSRPKLKTPLYQENYLNEFSTEEERAAARHALGLYNKGDVVAMSLLTAEDGIPSTPHLKEISVKQLRKGDVVFAPVTVFSAVFDTKGDSLEYKVQEIHTLINKQQSDIRKINDVSTSDTITSLGDVKQFLQGFNNGDHLNEILDDINQGVLRFENTGQILNKF